MNRIGMRDSTLTELTEQAVNLAARAIAYGLARLTDTYIPPPLADRFATRVAVVLLREVGAHDDEDIPGGTSPRH